VTTAIVLFTRDLRVHDQPALHAACERAEAVVPVFVLVDAVLASRYAAPNRVAYLREALVDLRASLLDRQGILVVRRGDTVGEVARLAREVDADELHLTHDVSGYAARRERALADLAAERGMRFEAHPGITAVEPGAVTTGDGGHYLVFTPYHRRWSEAPVRTPVAAPDLVPAPDGVATGTIPALTDLTSRARSPERPAGGESVARRRLEQWLDAGIAGYEDGRDDVAGDATSGLSAHLHFGCLSPTEIVHRLDGRRTGHAAFQRQLAWREFNHQLLAAHPDLPHRDLRSKGDRWRDDEEAVEAWKDGRTGYPMVDAGMRQLRREGFMHNRVRMLTASFLTKHLYVDWRVGAWHFMDWLVDGDLANNFAGWQWTAGTGTDSRPNRMFNPVTQGRRHDPHGVYVRRYVEELAHVDAAHVHAPWEARDTLLSADGYPPPIVDHREARARFLAGRDRSRPRHH
jgi:deoxyribodipyrimidine photo-lyase